MIAFVAFDLLCIIKIYGCFCRSIYFYSFCSFEISFSFFFRNFMIFIATTVELVHINKNKK